MGFFKSASKKIGKQWKTFQKKQERKSEKASRVYGHTKVLRKGGALVQYSFTPQAYAITVQKLKALGKPPLRGDALYEAVRSDSFHRISASGFLAAGWLSAINTFAKKIGKATRKSTGKFASRFGYGGATSAAPSNNPFTTFWNMASSRHTTTEDGKRIAEEGLNAAAIQTISKMREYVAKKQQQRTDKIFKKVFS